MHKLILALMFVMLSPNIKAQYTETLIFEDNCPTSKIVVNSKHDSKSKRISSRKKGIILYNNDSTLPDSVSLCIKIATDIWSRYLYNGDTLCIQICYDNIYDADVNTTIKYSSNDRKLFYPQSLWRKINKLNTEKENGIIKDIDAIVHINKERNWELGIGNISNGSKNLTYAIMRAIGTALGFGSNVKYGNRGEIMLYPRGGHTIFDELIFSENDKFLADKENNYPENLSGFVQQNSGYLYASKKLDDFKLYAPAKFDEFKSLRYLLDNKSLMYYNIPADTVEMLVDDTTIELLNSIGWNINTESEVEIIGDGIPETGITSGYQSHRFYLKTNGLSITNYTWKYELPLKNGGYEIVAQSTGTDFTIPSIVDENRYVHTADGDILGIITFDGLSANKAINAIYNITLELKPHIISAGITSIEQSPDDEYYYNIVFNVQYDGCDYACLTLEEEYNPYMDFFISWIPFYANFFLHNVNLYGCAWINIELENNYGKTTKTIEIPNSLRKKTSSGIENIEASNINYIEVYDIKGVHIRDIKSMSEINTLSKGLFLFKLYNNGCYIKTAKYYNI